MLRRRDLNRTRDGATDDRRNVGNLCREVERMGNVASDALDLRKVREF
jgi:hypothetical protein